ncbi:hypothetical protein VTN31DRAFT_6967 [Thermomyces dupontii]|uniref:uncharacterized protein n=1 Tax=Talaromyces thermophilus TaxID=28565 RepID=UPI003743D6FB
MSPTATEETKPLVVCVFCGSVAGSDPAHLEAARALAREFHKHNVQLVYGGGTNGIMGEIARTLVSLSGPQAVHGIIPRALVKVEEGYKDAKEADAGTGQVQTGSGKTHERTVTGQIAAEIKDKRTRIVESEYGVTTIVPDMHTRKRLMATKVMEGGPGSGFVALAGGFGTLEEVMEMTTWNQLGIHKAGIVVLNINGYWDGLLDWVRNSVEKGFVSKANGEILVPVTKVEDVLPKLLSYKASVDRFQLNWGEE